VDCQHCRAATVLSEALADAACRPYSSNEESAARYLHVFGLDQLDLLGDRPCADRFWFQSPRYLRAMALLENTQKAGRGDPGIDTAPPDRNRALSSNALDPTNPLCGTLIRSVSAHFEVTKIRLNETSSQRRGRYVIVFLVCFLIAVLTSARCN